MTHIKKGQKKLDVRVVAAQVRKAKTEIWVTMKNKHMAALDTGIFLIYISTKHRNTKT